MTHHSGTGSGAEGYVAVLIWNVEKPDAAFTRDGDTKTAALLQLGVATTSQYVYPQTPSTPRR